MKEIYPGYHYQTPEEDLVSPVPYQPGKNKLQQHILTEESEESDNSLSNKDEEEQQISSSLPEPPLILPTSPFEAIKNHLRQQLSQTE